MVTGGVIVFDDYGTVDGATKAIDELLQSQGKRPVIQKLPYNYIPAYVIKD
ncbi:hypothetical protein FACS1894139_02950 [Planctomycetales bacterium]|nr:hypothetical protein FACS1894107_11430 [Planctomycetales bacterium]GHT00701.1 hypothetical protein FACS1894108_13390 [Planctomycetales bacterium]GHT03208.1 hypothetical protein FACS1894139_02950 [Planctomycetales bacterium]